MTADQYANNRGSGRSLASRTLAVVLAGGRGSRLHGLTDKRAKPAVPFGGKYRLIDFALSNCLNSGIGRVGILTQYMSHSLNQHVQQGWGMSAADGTPMMQLLPAQQRTTDHNWYSGTADAIYQNLDILRSYQAEMVLVLAGDHIYKMDYRPLLEQHVQSAADMTICAIEADHADARQFGVLGVDSDGKVLRFSEKPDVPELLPGSDSRALVSMGVYVFNSDFLYKHLDDGKRGKSLGDDFGKDVIPALVKKRKIMSYSFRDEVTQEPAYWRDVGTLDAFWQSNIELIGDTPALDLYARDWPIRTLATQSPPTKFISNSDSHSSATVNSLIGDGCIISAAQIRNSVLCTNVIVQENCEIEECIVLPDCIIGENCHFRRVVLDRHCVMPAGMVIGHDEHFDEQRFHVSDKKIVLVTQAMIDKLQVASLRKAA